MWSYLQKLEAHLVIHEDCVQSSLVFYQNLRDDNESKMTIVHFLGQEKGIKKIATNVDENFVTIFKILLIWTKIKIIVNRMFVLSHFN